MQVPIAFDDGQLAQKRFDELRAERPNRARRRELSRAMVRRTGSGERVRVARKLMAAALKPPVETSGAHAETAGVDAGRASSGAPGPHRAGFLQVVKKKLHLPGWRKLDGVRR